MEKFKQKNLNISKHIIGISKHTVGILLDLSEGSAIKFITHRDYDALLCHHVYFGFCQNCPQYKCKKRRL